MMLKRNTRDSKSNTASAGKVGLKSSSVGYIMLIPGSILLLFISIYPLLNGIYLSFTDTKIFTNQSAHFIGFRNYSEILQDTGEFYPSLIFSVIFTLAVVVGTYIFGLFCALLLDNEIKFRNLFRAMMLLPWLVPTVVMGNIFIWMFAEHGAINDILLKTQLIDKPILFLATPVLAKCVVILAGIWRNLPFMFIVLQAGLQSIPPELYEAAEVDGAGYLRRLFSIQLPLLKGVSFVNTSLLFIWTINSFEIIWLITRGNPLKQTYVLPILSYFTAFTRGEIAKATAISVILLIVLSGAVVMYYRIRKIERFYSS